MGLELTQELVGAVSIGLEGLQGRGHGIPMKDGERREGGLGRSRGEEKVLGKMSNEDGVESILICGVLTESDVDLVGPRRGGRTTDDGHEERKRGEELLSSLWRVRSALGGGRGRSMRVGLTWKSERDGKISERSAPMMMGEWLLRVNEERGKWTPAAGEEWGMREFSRTRLLK
jgi:hypothetical protein